MANNLPTGVVPTNDIRGNGRSKLLIIGKTGTGKSSLCNILTGHPHNADIFPVSAEAVSCTQSTKFAEAFFLDKKENPISIIDTIGFDDPAKNEDAKIIAELVDKLKNQCDHVNLFVIAVNGQNPRLDGSLIGIIKIFEGMFTKQFWKQVVIVFTRVPMDKKSKSRREKNSEQTDDQLAAKYMKVVENQFKDARGLQYIFLDALYDQEDDVEAEAFETAAKNLLMSLERAPPLPTVQVQQVETEHAALKRQIKEKEKERQDAEKKFKEEIKKVVENAELNAQQKQDEINRLRAEHEDNGFSAKKLLGDLGALIDHGFQPIIGGVMKLAKYL